jgi:hypothetical protein
MKDHDEVKIAWVLWHLLFHLNDRIWDRYEKEFLELIGNPEELQEIDHIIADVKGCHLPF